MSDFIGEFIGAILEALPWWVWLIIILIILIIFFLSKVHV